MCEWLNGWTDGWVEMSVIVCKCDADGTPSTSCEPYRAKKRREKKRSKNQCARVWIVRCAPTHAFRGRTTTKSGISLIFVFFFLPPPPRPPFRRPLFISLIVNVLILICRFSVKTDLHTGRAVSRLYIANANRHDSGNYTCALGDFAKVTVSVHVLNGKWEELDLLLLLFYVLTLAFYRCISTGHTHSYIHMISKYPLTRWRWPALSSHLKQ